MSVADYKTTTHLKVLTQFLGKTDGKDKLLATLQYACLFISAGQPGNAKKIQASLASGRKVFRILRPLEVLMPLINDPTIKWEKSVTPQVLAKLKCLAQFVYFGADHYVWSAQAGLSTDKERLRRFQRLSMWGWFCASACTVGSEALTIAELLMQNPAKQQQQQQADGSAANGSTAAAAAKEAAKQAEIDRRMLVLFHAFVQGLLALGLLEKLPVKPRTVGAFGMIASALNCYMLYPAYPAPDSTYAKRKAAAAAAGVLPAGAPQGALPVLKAA